ncbi:MAG: hypothetical protein HYY83_06595, partial [Deltaproteobacteria bacterium]|nr:hypothetical protein [Deltaproteobacteria bacterium]
MASRDKMILACLLGIAVCSSLQNPAWGQAEGPEKLIEGAKKERSLVYYGSTSGPEALEMIRAFEKQYPF